MSDTREPLLLSTSFLDEILQVSAFALPMPTVMQLDIFLVDGKYMTCMYTAPKSMQFAAANIAAPGPVTAPAPAPVSARKLVPTSQALDVVGTVGEASIPTE
jgi:hypothetical protein